MISPIPWNKPVVGLREPAQGAQGKALNLMEKIKAKPEANSSILSALVDVEIFHWPDRCLRM